uniref:Uncharacterized protein n=1 Tax=Lactuca sativa TaxID=4236 RepID=A0A9R1WMR5_LACSA|nr:hypothetical protein LSAT_V11C100021970 [Lactuca sativa]
MVCSKKHRILSLDSTNEVKWRQLSSTLASLPIITSTASGSSTTSNLSLNRRRQLLVRRHLLTSAKVSEALVGPLQQANHFPLLIRESIQTQDPALLEFAWIELHRLIIKVRFINF